MTGTTVTRDSESVVTDTMQQERQSCVTAASLRLRESESVFVVDRLHITLFSAALACDSA